MRLFFFKGICLHAVAFSWSKDAEIVKSTELFTLSRYNRRNKANLLSAVSLDVAQCMDDSLRASFFGC